MKILCNLPQSLYKNHVTSTNKILTICTQYVITYKGKHYIPRYTVTPARFLSPDLPQFTTL